MSADAAVLALPGGHMASLGTIVDFYAMMRSRVADQFAPRDNVGMFTQLHIVSGDGGPVALSPQCSIHAEHSPRNGIQYRLIHIPDMACPEDDLPARWSELAGVLAWLNAQYAGGATITATGAGIYLLAQAGLLTGSVPLPQSMARAFRLAYPHLTIDTKSIIVERDRMWLGRGMAHDIMLLLRMIDKMYAPSIASSLAHAVGLISPVVEGLAKDPLVASAQQWLSERSSIPDLRIDAMAAYFAVSQKTLIRRFRAELGMTPRDYLRDARIANAKMQLGATARPISQIAHLVGYDDIKSFRNTFRELTGLTPSQFRTAARV